MDIVWTVLGVVLINFDPQLDPAAPSRFLDALYVSQVNLTSLGYGDISPAASLLRILGPIETLFFRRDPAPTAQDPG